MLRYGSTRACSPGPCALTPGEVSRQGFHSDVGEKTAVCSTAWPKFDSSWHTLHCFCCMMCRLCQDLASTRFRAHAWRRLGCLTVQGVTSMADDRSCGTKPMGHQQGAFFQARGIGKAENMRVGEFFCPSEPFSTRTSLGSPQSTSTTSRFPSSSNLILP